MIRYLVIALFTVGMVLDCAAQADLLAIEFNQDDQAGFDLWPGGFSGNSVNANFPTDPGVTSGTTTVTMTTSSGFGVPTNRGGLSDGNPPGFTYARLYQDLLIAFTPTGFLTIDVSGLNPDQEYEFTLYAWDPGATDASDKVWTVTGGNGDPASASVNFQDPLVDNESFALVFDITTTASGTFQVTNTGGLSQSAINGFKLAVEEIDPGAPPTITSQPQGTWDGGPEVEIAVIASGPEPLSYQWFLGGVAIAGATAETLVLDAEEWDRDGDYTVRVSNANGSVDSDAADVAIDIPVFPTREMLTYEPIGPSSRRSGIAISEILYHPEQRTDGRELEFVEIYNSQPWPEDIGGWRLSGEIDFVFADGTSVPANGFLVAARVPADVGAEFGIAGVVGPWDGNLSNEGGRVRLRKPSGAIVQQVDYNDRDPWPLAADGAGHSLVLARPSFGERDPRAWAASHSIGGSPGVGDPVPMAELDHVFVAEVLSNSELPAEDYIELRNAARFSVDVSGCLLSDARDSLGLFEIPAGTTIAGGGTIRFSESELGFALDSAGDAVYLTDPTATRVLDAVSLPAAATDVPFVRPRSDASLRAMSMPQVVINELMFHPPTHDGADEWIELYNVTDSAIDLDGWALTDGIEFVFPDGAEISANGFLVIAKDRARTLANHPSLDPAIVLGDYGGNLSDGGERVALSRPDDGILVAEDAVDFADSNRYHRFADGRGASLERIDAHGPSRAASNWADSDESAKAGWTAVEFTGTLAHGNGSAAANQVQMFLMGPGEALVDSVEVVPEGGGNIVPNGGFESGTSGWFFQGNHRDSVLETGDAFSGSNSLRLLAARRGDTGPNRARAPLGQTLASGSRATLRARVRWLAGHPEFLMRLRGNWLEAAGRLELPTNLGTPGAANSRAEANAGPHIDLVTHRPVLPEAGEAFGVFAQVADPDGVGDVSLRYRIDPSPTVIGLPMLDDGVGVDLTAGDGIFSAQIPAQSAGALVAFQVVAEDADAIPASSMFPPVGECLARVGEPANGVSFGTYRMWITQADIDDWDTQPFRANNPYPITFVYNDTRPIYAAGAYYGGNKDSHGHPLSGSVSYDVLLPPDDEFLGAGKLTFDYPVRDATNQREQLMHWFADQLKLPTLHRRDIYLYMNGVRRRTIYHDAEQPDGVLAESHFPGDRGELFKTANDNETTDGGSRIRPFVRNRLDVFEADGEIRAARYRWTTGARARGSRTRLDDTTIIDLMRRADDTGPDYERRLSEIIDMDNWMRTWAMIDLASYWDAFGNTNWKNTYIYKPESAGWVQFTWDFDVGLGVDSRDPFNQALFPSGVDANIQRMYQTPAFVRSYWRAMDESLAGFFSGAAVTPILEARRAAYAAAGLSFTSPFAPSGGNNISIPGWIDARAAFIAPQLAAVEEPFDVSAPADGSSGAAQTITLSGTAPVAVATIEVNGIALELDWASVGDWSAQFVLAPGANNLLVRALAPDGSEIAGETLTVTYTGAGGWPDLAINEWMADNESALADPADGDFEDWIEIFNPTGPTVDLEGWFLSDDEADPFKHRIPADFDIGAGGFLLVWADGESAQNDPATRPDLHVDFKLAAGGESILLSAPDGTLIDRVDFGQQSPDKTMGRTDGEIAALASPSPEAANGRAAIGPSVTVRSGGATLTFTIAAEPGFLYLAEASDDLLNWEDLGPSQLATGDTVELTFSIDRARRFYRFRRTP